MDEKEIRKKLKDFKQDFQLTSEEVNAIAKPETPGFEKRVRRMNIVREELNKFSWSPNVLHGLLTVRHRGLKSSYFELMVDGYFDKVIEHIQEQ